MALCTAAAQAQDIDSNAVAVAFSGGDTAGAPGVVNGVLLNLEVTDQQIAESGGFRSMSLTVDVDCRGGRERLRKAAAFALPNLVGTAQPRGVSGEWETPETYMREVIKTICTMHSLRFIEQVADGENAAVAHGPTSPAEPPKLPTSAATSEPADAAPVAAPSPPPNAYPVPDAAPAVAAVLGPPPSGPRTAADFIGQARVQIASSPSRADAEAMLNRSAAVISPPLKGEVEVAMVHGRTVYRSIIAPFASEAEAQAFCARTGLTLEGCFVWRSR
ncbi:MAG: SPOR domain-containing protein [Caulobacteraceae bacterium]